MANRSAILSLRVIADTKGAVSGLKRAGSAVGGFLKVAGAAAIAAAGIALIKYGKDAIGMAGNLEQSVGAIDTVFKKNAKQMHAWSKGAQTSVGLTRNEYNELGTLIGTQLKNGGSAMDQLAPKTNNLIKLGADLSSMFGGTSKEAVEALSSALKGERDPIEKYGVSLNQAKIDAEAAALGFKKTGGALSTEANQAATLSLIMKQTSDAHGNFAKEAGTMQGQLQRANATWKNIQTTIGQLFLPVITTVMTFINQNVLPGLQRLVEGLGKGGGAFKALQPIIDSLRPALDVFASVWRDSLLPAIQGFATQAAPLINSVKQTIAVFAAEAGPILTGVANTFKAIWTVVGPVVISIVSGIVQNIIGFIQGMLNVIQGVVRLVSAIFQGDWKAAWEALKQIVSGAVQAVWNFVQLWIVGRLVGGVKAAMTLVKGGFKSAMTFITGAVRVGFTAVKTIALNIMNGFKAAIQGNLKAAVGFFKAVPGNIVKALGNVGSLLVKAGKSIIGGFLKGLKSGWDKVTGFVGGIGSWIADHKGPISYDKKLLVPAGTAIMGGLIRSMKAQMPNLKRTLRGVTGEIMGLEADPTVDLNAPRRSSSGTAVSRGGNTYVFNLSGMVGDKIGLAKMIKKLIEDADKLVGANA